MKRFCENPHCEAPGFKVVRVSVEKPSDRTRMLCATCEEAFTWGVQHGRRVARKEPCLPRIQRFLKKSGFLVVGRNRSDPSPEGAIEAWAYKGPLDFKSASPVTFGVGKSVREALNAINRQLTSRRHRQVSRQPLTGVTIQPPPEETGDEPLYRVAYLIDVNASDVHEAAEYAHRIMTDPDSLPPVLQVIDPKGNATVVDLSEGENTPVPGPRPK